MKALALRFVRPVMVVLVVTFAAVGPAAASIYDAPP
jgi:hypothetical protein